MIGIIDYGLGNVKAFANVYHKLNIPAIVVNRPHDLQKATHIILPGVGAFDHAMSRLENSGMRQDLNEIVLQRHTPILGICVGMQILARSSEEGKLPGLGWIDGEVKRLHSPNNNPICLPHMGWNNVKPKIMNGLFRGIDKNSRFYFLHSYFFNCQRSDDVLAITDYYGQFTCAARFGNIYGVQFHPEKSHQWGIQLLKNFAEL